MASAAEQLAANMNFGAFQKATELHKRLWFTLGALIVYRLGTYIPIPGIDHDAFMKAFESQSQGMLGMFNMFSGGAVQRMAIFSLNVMPYISASIIVQLLGTIYGPWEKLRKEGGEAGRKQLNQYTRYLTVILAIAQAFGIAVGLQNSNLAVHPGIFFLVATVTTLTGGTLFLMWLGEQITSRGVGNGSSLIIFAGIVAGIPGSIGQILELVRQGQVNGFLVLLLAVAAVGVIAFIVFMERSQRRLLVQYPKRQQAGGRVVGGENSFMPLKLNASGVIPPIFASSLLLLPTTALGFLTPKSGAPQSPVLQTIQQIVAQLSRGHLPYDIAYAVMIIFFTFFYTSVIFNPEETAENLRKYGGFLPGIRPGKRTADYIDYVVTRLTVIGAAYITAVCLLPEVFSSFFGRAQFGGTTLLIVVSVTMDTVAQIQSHLLAHQYEGLIKKAKLRGRGR